jgi:8-oxo-dGTP pyrophosphatase MutT (NUDIX family)
MRDARDRSAEETALREFEEELGVARGVVEVLEALPEVLTVTTGYEVTPVIGRLPAGLTWRPDPREVAEVFSVLKAALEDPANRTETEISYPGWNAPRMFPCVRVEGRIIWGLTYRILERVLPRLP